MERRVRMEPFAPWPVFSHDEIEAVRRVLESGRVNYWTGEEGRKFEQEFATKCGARHAVALANGTVALEAALASLGVGANDEVITSSRTFIASASCAAMRGAIPVIADVDEDSQNITAKTVEPLITERTRAIVAVHLAGWPCEMDDLWELANVHDLVLVEDCAQATGAVYRGRAVGSFAHAGAFSFCQDKIMTTGGEGGMLITNDDAVWSQAWSIKDHGKSFEATRMPGEKHAYRWLHESFGTNWRMTEMQAAIGRVQLRELDLWLRQRRANAEFLLDELERVDGLRVPRPPAHLRPAWYKFYAFVRSDMLRANRGRDWILSEINEAGVPCFWGSCSEIYREKAFSRMGLGPKERLPVAHELGQTSLMFLVHPTINQANLEYTVHAVKSVMRRAVK